MQTNTPKKIIIIGGLSAGPSAAARARRIDPNAEIFLFEKSNYISYATCGIPYAVSGVIPYLSNLTVVEPKLLEKRFNIRMHLEEEVLKINPEQKTIETPKGTYPYDRLILATGASPIIPPIPGLNEAANATTVRSMKDTAQLSYRLKQPKIGHVTVLGGGLIGVEMAENIQKLGKRVTVLEGGPQLLSPFSQPMGEFARLVLQHHGVEVKVGQLAKAVTRDGERIVSVTLSDGSELATDYVVISVGVRPNTSLLTGDTVQKLANGALIVNERMETSLPGIYAAGDCVAIKDRLTGKPAYYPLGTHSNKGGRIAGTNAAGGSGEFSGAYGTAIVQVMDHTFARTGYHPEVLKKEGIPFNTTCIIASATPSYYPGAEPLWVQVYSHAESGQILGAEVSGKVGADKRIDVLSTAIYAKLTIDDLSELDLAYAPPYSPAKDPVCVAGFVAQNERDGLVKTILPADLAVLLASEKPPLIVDVRSHDEQAHYGIIPGALCIPLDQLTEFELPDDKTAIIYCQKGLRGYLGVRKTNVATTLNLAGGFEAWAKSGLPVLTLDTTPKAKSTF